MRFMVMHKNDPHTEAGLPPPMDIVTKMGAFIGEYARDGRFVDGAGLGASKTRTRLVFRGGRSTVKHGPYAGEHELPAAARRRQRGRHAQHEAEGRPHAPRDRDDEGGRAPPLVPARAEREGQAPALHQQPDACARRAVRGDEGAHRRLLGDGALGNEAIGMCRRYVEILGGTVEIDVRPIDPSERAA